MAGMGLSEGRSRGSKCRRHIHCHGAARNPSTQPSLRLLRAAADAESPQPALPDHATITIIVPFMHDNPHPPGHPSSAAASLISDCGTNTKPLLTQQASKEPTVPTEWRRI